MLVQVECNKKASFFIAEAQPNFAFYNAKIKRNFLNIV